MKNLNKESGVELFLRLPDFYLLSSPLSFPLLFVLSLLSCSSLIILSALSLSLSCPRPPASPWLTSSQNLVAPIPSVLLLQFPLFSFWHRVRQTEIGMPVTIFEMFFCWASARPPQSPDPNRSHCAGSSLQNAVRQGQQGLGLMQHWYQLCHRHRRLGCFRLGRMIDFWKIENERYENWTTNCRQSVEKKREDCKFLSKFQVHVYSTLSLSKLISYLEVKIFLNRSSSTGFQSKSLVDFFPFLLTASILLSTLLAVTVGHPNTTPWELIFSAILACFPALVRVFPEDPAKTSTYSRRSSFSMEVSNKDRGMLK